MEYEKIISCRAVPYEGEEPYIFFSYCHKNAEAVYPVIEHMAEQGYRIWYDNGIHPGDDWPETIASHISQCAVCIAVVSPESMESHNCRNEINFVLEYDKKLIPVIWEEFQMSLGMKLQLGACQYIKKYEYSEDKVFLQNLLGVDALEVCRGENSLLWKADDAALLQQIEQQKQSMMEHLIKKQQDMKKKLKSELGEKGPEILDKEYEPTVVEDKTVRIIRKNRQRGQMPKAVLIRLSNRQEFLLEKPLTKIGRSQRKCDVVIDDCTISSLHAEVLYSQQGFYLRDADSANGTMVDGKMADAMEPVPLKQCALLELAEELCLFASGEFAEWIEKENCCVFLHCIETEEKKLLTEKEFSLGRANIWEEGTFGDRRASYHHGTIRQVNEKYMLITGDKETTNGTFINDRKLELKEEVELHDQDEIGIGTTYRIIFHRIDLKSVIN